MDILGLVLVIVAAILVAYGVITFYVAAFKQHVAWAIACFLIPPIKLFFLIFHWDKGGQPFLFQCAGYIIFVAGLFSIAPFDI